MNHNVEDARWRTGAGAHHAQNKQKIYPNQKMKHDYYLHIRNTGLCTSEFSELMCFVLRKQSGV